MQRKELVDYLHQILKVDDFNDYCPNGLQVEGRPEIKHIVAGVTASQALIDRAVEQKADAVLVHHGFFWRGENPVLTGMKYKRIKSLIKADINLLAYHLPLDVHPEFGNNVQLANVLGIKVTASQALNGINGLLWQGEFADPITAGELAHLLEQKLQRRALWLPESSGRKIKTLAWCSGGAQNYIENAAELGVDAYISGEVSEQTTHQALELDIHYFAAGHHATERYGVKALAEHLMGEYGITIEFIDIENPA